MQGQRGIIGSLPETLEFDHGSSGNAIMDPQLRWNNMRSSADNRLAEFVLPSSHINNTFVNPIDQERQDLSSWQLDEPSSSGAQNEFTHDMQKVEHGWLTTSSSCGGSGPRLEDMRYESRNILSLDNDNVNPQSMQISGQDVIPQNLNLNASFVGHGNDDCQVIERLNTFKPGGAVTEQVPPTGGSDSLLHPSGSGGYLVEETAGRPGSSLDGRRQSCKRKAVEGNIGQSSASGSSSFFQRSDGSAWSGTPAHLDAVSSLNIPSSTENQSARLGLGIRGLASNSAIDSVPTCHGESSNRNFRLRINPSNRDRESIPANLFSTGGAVRRPNMPYSNHSSRLLPVDHSSDVRSSLAVEGPNLPGQPVIIPVPALPQNAPPFRWNEGSSSRANLSSRSINLGDRDESSSRTTARNLWQHPMAVAGADLRALVRNPTNRSGSNASISIPGNVAASSRSSSSSGVHPIPAPPVLTAASPHSRYSRRMADYVLRSLSSVNGADSGGQGSFPVHPGISAASEDMVLPSGANHQAHQRPYPRLSSWMERHVEGIAYPLRALSASGEGNRRLVVPEQIRNVLDLMRRESLRFEDVMVLDQSVLFGVPDIHDRHRDMRLDVDNMSYEELLALGERIGSVNTGLSEETIENGLRRRNYVGQEKGETDAEPCCVCQEDYNDGEDVGTLDCGHDFHSDCIKQWLKHKNLCPICKTTGLAT